MYIGCPKFPQISHLYTRYTLVFQKPLISQVKVQNPLMYNLGLVGRLYGQTSDFLNNIDIYLFIYVYVYVYVLTHI